MVSFELEGEQRQSERFSGPSLRYRVVTHSLIVGQTVYKKGDIISSTEVDMDLRYYTGLRLIELIDDSPLKLAKKKPWWKRLFSK